MRVMDQLSALASDPLTARGMVRLCCFKKGVTGFTRVGLVDGIPVGEGEGTVIGFTVGVGVGTKVGAADGLVNDTRLGTAV